MPENRRYLTGLTGAEVLADARMFATARSRPFVT